MIKKYVKKPIEVEAIQWTGDNTTEVEKFINWRACQNIYGKSMVIEEMKSKNIRYPLKYIGKVLGSREIYGN